MNKGSMIGQDNTDRIADLLKQACPPAVASPEFKAQLHQQLNQQAAALGAASPKPLWQHPLLWIPAAAASAVVVAIVVYFIAFHSTPLAVTTSDATAIQATTAILNGNLDSLGTADEVEVSFEWGLTTLYGNETTPELRKATDSITANLSGLAPNTTYHYRIKAVSSHGTVYGPDMQFTTGPAPPAATTGDAAEIKSTSATLNGRLDDLGSAAAVNVSFEWGLTTLYGNETTPESKTATGTYSADLSSLAPNTTYHFRTKVVGDGTTYGTDAQFTTGITPPEVTTKSATSISTDSVQLNGELDSLGTASSVHVSFEWGIATGSYTHTTDIQVWSIAGTFSADLSGLTPGTTYYFRAKADGDGAPMYGQEKSFATSTTPPAARTCSATEVSCMSATLNGVLDSLGTAESVAVSFQWGISTAFGNETTPQTMTATGGFSASLTGLIPNTTYHFRAMTTGHGDAYGDDIVFTTGRIPPAQKTWYLSADSIGSQLVMYEGDASQPSDIVRQNCWDLTSLVWTANQSSSDMRYPVGNWLVQLRLGDFEKDHTDNIEIGTWDGSVFAPYGVCTIHGLGDALYYDISASVSVGSFTVPSGGQVAIRITVTSSPQLLDVYVGGEDSFVQSPSYPEPTAPIAMTSAATNLEPTTATLNGYLESAGTAGSVTLYFEWGTTANYGNEIEAGIMTSPGIFSAALADLVPDTTYHFRTKAVGDGVNCGVDMIFITPS